MTIVRVREHGSYVIEGDDVTVIDWNGNPYPIERRPIALCRCGASSTRPFCDGSHRRAEAAATVPPAPAEKP